MARIVDEVEADLGVAPAPLLDLRDTTPLVLAEPVEAVAG
jgi:hypothetical protein